MSLFNKPDRPAEPTSGGWLSRLSERLSATRQTLSDGVGGTLFGRKSLNADFWENLEAQLLRADLGVEATQAVIDGVQQRCSRRELTDPAAVYATIKTVLREMLAPCTKPLRVDSKVRPFVIMVVGVNGAGKTTTVGKLAYQFAQANKRVMLAAADTFRAAAREQLQAWAERAHAPLITGSGDDAAAVAHDALRAAISRGHDVLLIDTAGRLHTQTGLMEELKKVKRVLSKLDGAAPHEVLLVLDAGNGQNILSQLQQFHAAVGVTGLCLTKLDGTAKGGVLFAVARKLPVPIRYVGVGEDLDDLRPFDAAEFVDAVLPNTPAHASTA